MAPERFEVEKDLEIEEEKSSESENEEGKQTKSGALKAAFETEINPASQYKMEVDLEFRAKFQREQNMAMFEVLEALDKSSVEDLISYKLKEDKEANLLTLDDLRYQ